MICVVLAAGYATRMYPLTESYPKPLLPVQGKPILDWLMEDIDKIEEIHGHVIVSNHRYSRHFQEWARCSRLQRPVHVVDDGSMSNDTRLGAVNDILLAIERLRLEDDLLVIAGDNVLDFSLQSFVRFAKKKDASCIMCYHEPQLEVRRRSGVVTLDRDFKVLRMEEKPDHPQSYWITPPFYIYHQRDLPLLRQSVADGCHADAPGSLFAWLSKKREVYAYNMRGRRYDVGNMSSYHTVQRVFRGIHMPV